MNLHLNEIIKALRARCPSFGGRVAGASQWAVDRLSEVEDPDYPAAYVVLENEQGGEVTINGQYNQHVDVSFAVIVLVGNQDREDLRGQNTLEQIDSIRGELFKALLFWSPAERQLEKIVFDGAECILLDPARMAYRFDFKTRYRLDRSDTYQVVEQESYPNFNAANLDLSGEQISVNGQILLEKEK